MCWHRTKRLCMNQFMDSSQSPYAVGTIMTPILQMGRLRHREVGDLPEAPQLAEEAGFEPCRLTPGALLLTTDVASRAATSSLSLLVIRQSLLEHLLYARSFESRTQPPSSKPSSCLNTCQGSIESQLKLLFSPLPFLSHPSAHRIALRTQLNVQPLHNDCQTRFSSRLQFLKEKPHLWPPTAPCPRYTFCAAVDPGPAEEDPVTKPPVLIIQTFRPSPLQWVSPLGNFATGICGMTPLTFTGPGFGHWRMWSYQRSPAPLGKPCSPSSHSLGVRGVLPRHPPHPNPVPSLLVCVVGIPGKSLESATRWS